MENPSLDTPIEEKEGACLTEGSCEACAEGAELVELPIDTTHGRGGGQGRRGGNPPTDKAKNQERTEVPPDRRKQNAGRHRAAGRYSLSATKHP